MHGCGVAAGSYADLRTVAAESLVRGNPLTRHHRRAQRDLTAQDCGRDDLGKFAYLATAIAAQQFQALALRCSR